MGKRIVRPVRSSRRRGWRQAAREAGPLLVALPLAAFTAVLLWDGAGPQVQAAPGFDPATASSEAELRRRTWPDDAVAVDARQPELAAARPETYAEPIVPGRRLSIGPCGSGARGTCVVDGDTIWLSGTKIRMADYDTPEVYEPGCAAEARAGAAATARLTALLNSGEVELHPNPEGRATDRYGRALLVVTVDGASVGDTLVSEGLAERWGGPRIAWC